MSIVRQSFPSILIILALTGCSSLATPTNFLRADAGSPKDWLNTVVDVDLENVPLSDLPKRTAFQGLNLILSEVNGDSVVSLETPHVTRRQALWLLANQYGLTMLLAHQEGHPITVVVTNRELLRPNVPLK